MLSWSCRNHWSSSSNSKLQYLSLQSRLTWSLQGLPTYIHPNMHKWRRSCKGLPLWKRMAKWTSSKCSKWFWTTCWYLGTIAFLLFYVSNILIKEEQTWVKFYRSWSIRSESGGLNIVNSIHQILNSTPNTASFNIKWNSKYLQLTSQNGIN